MPLLMSSRMTSAGLTVNRSASSLTVIVVGSSTAPRSRGSATWTAAWNAPSRRGGLRGPRRPRVPLLLPALGDSAQRTSAARRQGRLQGTTERAAVDGGGDAGFIATDVRTAAV